MLKTIFSRNNRSVLLSVVAISYLVMMFIIWNVNIEGLGNYSATINRIANYIFVFALLLNIDRVTEEKKLKTIVIYIAIMILLILNSFFITYGYRSRVSIFSVIPIFIVYLLAFQLEGKRILKYGFHALLILFFFYNVVGVVGAIYKFDYFFLGIPNELVDNYRYSSILTNPNSWGEFALISLFISTYFLMKNKEHKKRLIYFVFILASLFALIASMSRTSILIAVILYFGLIVFAQYLDNLLKKLLYISFILAILGFIGLLLFNKEFVVDFLRLTQGLTDRDVIWKHMIEEIKVTFWHGVGYGNGTLVLSFTDDFPVTSAHNLYLGLLFEMGFIPFVILMIYFIKKILENFLYLKYTKKYTIELLWIGIFLIAFLVGQMFEYSFFKVGPMNTFIFVLLGLSIQFIGLSKEEGIYKKKITHMISGLLNGGSESMLYKVLKYGDKSKYRFKVISLGTKGFYGEKIEALGIKVVALNMKSVKTLPVAILKLFHHVKGSDVLQTWLYHANLLGVIVGRILLVDKIIWGVRQADISEEHNKKSTVKIAEGSKYLSWMTDYILSCSDETTLEHQKLGYSAKRFVTIYNGFELSLFKYDPNNRDSMRKELGIKDEIVFINVARYDVQKDHDTMFGALKRFKETTNLPFKVIMCGIGIEKSNEDLVAKLVKANLTNEAILLGVRSDVAALMSAADYFLLSSLGEGFPNVLGEAMASELIPIVTNVGDCAMIVGDTGEVVPKQDPIAFYNGLMRIVNLDEKEKKKKRKEARMRIENTFDIVEITKQYEALY